MNYIEFLRNAKAQLSGHWGEAALGTLIVTVSQGVFWGIMSILVLPLTDQSDELESFYVCLGVGYFFSTLLTNGPLLAGYIKFIQTLVKDGNCDFSLIWAGFRTGYLRNCGIYLMCDIVIGGIAYVSNKLLGQLVENAGLPTVVFIIILIIYVIYFIYVFIRFFGVAYLMVNDSEYERYGVWEIIQLNSRLMNNRVGEMTMLGCHFMGWIFLTLLTGGIGILLLWPYEIVAFTNYYDSIKNKGGYEEPSSDESISNLFFNCNLFQDSPILFQSFTRCFIFFGFFFLFFLFKKL